MPRYDQPGVRYDAGFRYDTPDPVSNPDSKTKKTRKTMRHERYFPLSIGGQIVWLTNFEIQLPAQASALTLDPQTVTNRLLDTSNALYGLKDYRSVLPTTSQGCYQCIQENLYGSGDATGNVTWAGFTPPAPIPATVPKGCLTRIFDFIENEIKTSPGYTDTIGQLLGVIGEQAATPDQATTVPDFALRLTEGGKVEVVWRKGVFDGVKMEFDLGPAGMRSDVDTRPNYTLNWLPAVGQSAIIRTRLRYIYKGDEFGQWSDWQSWTLTGE
jgi:hypothetical protein